MIECIDCGVSVTRLSTSHKRCTDCAKARKREQVMRWRNENRRRTREYAEQYRLEHRDEILARKAEWRSSPSVKAAASASEARYRAENRDARRRHERRRQERDALINDTRSMRKWTPEEDAVIESWSSSLRELAAILERSPSAVKKRKQRLRKAGLLT